MKSKKIIGTEISDLIIDGEDNGEKRKNNLEYEIGEVLAIPQEVSDEDLLDSIDIIEISDEDILDYGDVVVLSDEDLLENGDDVILPEILYGIVDDSDLDIFRSLSKGYDENVFLEEFGEPKNIIYFGDEEILYVTNCLLNDGRKYVVGYVKKGNQVKLRLFYRSKSEGAWRSCPGARDGEGYSKGEGIKNSSYETTTRLSHEMQYRFDFLPEEEVKLDPILYSGDLCGTDFLEPEMISEINIDKLFKKYKGDTCDSFDGKTSADVIKMYRKLGKEFNLDEMKLLEGKGYTYEHQYLGTVKVQVCRLNYKGKDIDFHFARVKDDPFNRVRIEQLTYADAKLTSFLINDKQINASPLTGKPIEYSDSVPEDMKNNERVGGSSYVDVRDLYQENPVIKWFKRNIQ